MENKIPTAEEFIRNEYEQYSGNLEAVICNGNHVEFMMKEFAKIHVKAALEAAAENIQTTCLADRFLDGYDSKEDAEGNVFDKNSILNAYPYENIK